MPFLKKSNPLFLIVFVSFLYSCQNCHLETYESFSYNPLYLTKDSLESMVRTLPPREVNRPGGIYYKNGFVYILELGNEDYMYTDFLENGSYHYNLRLEETGIHVIDDSDPSNPTNVSFIAVPGINGLTAKDDKMYADSFADLLVFDLQDPAKPSLENRVNNVYTNLAYHGLYLDDSLGYIVGYETTPVSYSHEVCDGVEDYYVFNDCHNCAFQVDALAAESFSSGPGDIGVSGSITRFATVGNYLYNIDYSDLHLFDISGDTPEKITDIHVGWEIETIYPYEDKLFFGAVDGMFIYDNSNPSDPQFLSKYEHVTSCDPVVVRGDYAYVTLRSGSACQGFSNQLDIVNISDPTTPFLAKTYQMDNPHGLSLFDNCLYICEGDFGLKTFTVDFFDPTDITQVNIDQSIHAFDVITLPEMLMVVGEDGFYQYSRNCGSTRQYLGVIPF